MRCGPNYVLIGPSDHFFWVFFLFVCESVQFLQKIQENALTVCFQCFPQLHLTNVLHSRTFFCLGCALTVWYEGWASVWCTEGDSDFHDLEKKMWQSLCFLHNNFRIAGETLCYIFKCSYLNILSSIQVSTKENGRFSWQQAQLHVGKYNKAAMLKHCPVIRSRSSLLCHCPSLIPLQNISRHPNIYDNVHFSPFFPCFETTSVWCTP